MTVDAEQIETRQAELAAKPGELLKGAFADGRQEIHRQDPRHRRSDRRRFRPGRARPPAPRVERSRCARDDGRRCGRPADAGDLRGRRPGICLRARRRPGSPRRAGDPGAPLPASEDLVLGMASFRDTLLPLLSLRGLLGFAARDEHDGREKVVVTRVGGALVGLVADRMRTIFAADPDLIEQIPPVLAARDRRRSQDRRDLSRRRRAPADLDPVAGAAVPGGCHAALERRRQVRAGDRQRHRRSRGEERQFVVFRLGDDEFGLPIEAVDEVARVPDADHAAAQDAEIPRRRGQFARRGAAGGRSAPPLRHAGARGSKVRAA